MREHPGFYSIIHGGDIPQNNDLPGTKYISDPFYLIHDFGKGTNVLWIAHASWTQNNNVIGWPTGYNDNQYSVIASDTSGNSTAVATRTR